MGGGVYMLPSDMNLNIRSGGAGYNNEILVSNSRFSLERDDMVNTSVPEKSSHKTPIVPKHAQEEVLPSPKHTSAIMHREEKIALVLIVTGASEYNNNVHFEGVRFICGPHLAIIGPSETRADLMAR